jgi:hypothetical protein
MRLAALVLVFTGCFYDEGMPLPADFGSCPLPNDTAAPVGVAEPTWYRDVQPIIVAKCQGCHTEGGLAPFPLDTLNRVSARRGSIHEAVATRTMPPWQPDPCCTPYRWDRSLSDAQRETVLRWFDIGMPTGDAADAPIINPPAAGLPHVDLIATMPAPFIPAPKVGADELRCFLLDHDAIDRTRYITGFDFKPGSRAMVHHVIVYAIPEDEVAALQAKDGVDGRPGWDCYGQGGELSTGSQYIGGWQPGVLPRVLPDGIGRLLPARTRIMLNVHYDTGHGAAPDLSSIDIMLEDRVERVERGAPIGNPLWFAGEGMAIAAHDPDATAWFAYDPSDIITRGKAVDIHNVMLHMHELGTIGRVAILRADGTTDCLLNITRWDFHWMADYYFETPVRLEPGDKVYVECHWDNTAANQKVVNGEQLAPRTLHWATDDEMCGAVLTYSTAVGS